MQLRHLGDSCRVRGAGSSDGWIHGDRLMAACANRSEHDSALCLGYIVDVADAMQASKTSDGTLIFGWRACLPPGTTAEEVRYVAVHFLIAHPEAARCVTTPASCDPTSDRSIRSPATPVALLQSPDDWTIGLPRA